ncbi:hypothetical protein SO694_00006332 [Aureococcus anophagefferens]|uniref:Disease resistance R13L4/SHOC-2-like LRR domain-containing protein n=1 Tax=Aureococcus anophagefferens TaxID=44056 RepID=A0ABR1GAR6_AURAN
MGACSAKSAASDPKSVDEVIARVVKTKGATLDLSAAPAGSDAPPGLLHRCGLSLGGEVPEAVYGASSVTTLSLKTGSRAPPAELGALACLATLDVSENKLATLPAEVGKLGKLTTLVAFKNVMTALPDALATAALANLNLYNNKLTKLPATLANLENLEDVNLGANKLKMTPKLDKWSKVRELRLHQNNLISQFLPSFAGLASLELLKIERNLALSAFPALGLPALALPELTTLNAGSNKALRARAGPHRAPKLRVLFVDDCAIVEVDAANTPAAFPGLERLQCTSDTTLESSCDALRAVISGVMRGGDAVLGPEQVEAPVVEERHGDGLAPGDVRRQHRARAP